MEKLLGVYKCVVLENAPDIDIPYLGAFKVGNVDLFGYSFQGPVNNSRKGNYKNLLPSNWVEPVRGYSTDYSRPEKGDWVYISFVDGDLNQPILIGYASNKDDTEYFNVLEEGEESREEEVPEYLSNRVVRTRNGSHLTIEEDEKGKVTIESRGKATYREGKFPQRVGAKVVIDSLNKDNTIYLTVPESEESETAITSISMNSKGELSVIGGENKITFKKEGLKLEESNGATVFLKSDGKILVKNTSEELLGIMKTLIQTLIAHPTPTLLGPQVNLSAADFTTCLTRLETLLA